MKESVRELYDTLKTIDDAARQVGSPSEDIQRKRIQRAARLVNEHFCDVPGSVIDIGCGVADLYQKLDPYCVQYYHAVEMQDWMYEKARVNLAKWRIDGIPYETHFGDYMRVPFDPGHAPHRMAVAFGVISTLDDAAIERLAVKMRAEANAQLVSWMDPYEYGGRFRAFYLTQIHSWFGEPAVIAGPVRYADGKWDNVWTAVFQQ